MVTWNGGGCRLRDLASTNGTFVNNKRITVKTLSLGDVIRAGDVELLFEKVTVSLPPRAEEVPSD